MTLTVSISDFRQNISEYLEKASKGNTIVVKNKKRGQEVVEIKARSAFDQKKYHQEYARMLKRVAGTFTAKNHPEWATRTKVEKWLRESRLADERNFGVSPR